MPLQAASGAKTARGASERSKKEPSLGPFFEPYKQAWPPPQVRRGQAPWPAIQEGTANNPGYDELNPLSFVGKERQVAVNRWLFVVPV